MSNILSKLADLYRQATIERSHYYVGECCEEAMTEIRRLQAIEREALGVHPTQDAYDASCRALHHWRTEARRISKASGIPMVPLLPSMPTHSIDDIQDEVLLRRAVTSARDSVRGKHPRWTGVMARFQLGSTYAMQLCRRYDLDPDEMVKR